MEKTIGGFGLRTLVIDNGSGTIKGGYYEYSLPEYVIPAVIGIPKCNGCYDIGKRKEYYLGDEAMQIRGVLKLKHPISDGIIKHWEDMELLWSHVIYQEAKWNPEESGILMADRPISSASEKEKTTQLVFELFRTPWFNLHNQESLALYESGRLNGVVLNSGEEMTYFVHVDDGYHVPSATRRVNLAGRTITDYLCKLLAERGINLTTTAEREIVREVKEKYGCVVLDYEKAMKEEPGRQYKEVRYETPDGLIFTLDKEMFRCVELLFKPPLQGYSLYGVIEYIHKLIYGADPHLRWNLYQNIVLAGASTLFPGFRKRLENGLKLCCPPSNNVIVTAPPLRKFGVWRGGSIVSQLSSFSSMCITKAAYEEYGPSIVHRKCL